MALDTSAVQPVDAPPLKPLSISPKLAPTPTQKPKYSVQIKNSKGEPVTLGDPVATRALVALMDLHAVNGGAACHWGGPAAFAEIMAAIHGIMFSVKDRPWHEAFNFVNDAGHTENGIYALRANYGFDQMTFEDLKHFRSLQSKLTGHGESHLNPQGVLLSNGPLSSALPQAQGLALADRMAQRDRVTICTVSDGAAMEGEAKEAFAAIPGLAARGLVNPFVLVLSDNDTKLSGRISKDAFDMRPTFEAFATLGWNVIHVEEGHNLQKVYLAIERGIHEARQNPKKSVCLWVKTIKGYGVKSTMDNAAGGHGFPLANGEKIVDFVNEIYSGNPPQELGEWALALRKEWEQKQQKKEKPSVVAPTPKTTKVQAGLADGAIQAAKEGFPVVSITSDVPGSTGISTFQKSFPDRTIDVGVAEANMISTGAGFSKAGFIPIVDTFGQFGVTKGNLPLTMASLSQAPLIAIFSHVGFQDAADGASHQATTYFAAMSAIPNTTVISCSCYDEAKSLMYQAIGRTADARQRGKEAENIIFFVGRENYPVHYVEKAFYPWGKAQVLQKGNQDNKAVIVACGPMVGKALEAAHLLREEKKIEVAVINNPFINRPDIETIGQVLKSCNKLVTIEDHQVVCGMGAQLVHSLSLHGIQAHVRSLGMQGEFGQSAYLADHLYDQHRLNTSGIIQAVKELC